MSPAVETVRRREVANDIAALPSMLADLVVDARAAARQDHAAADRRLRQAMDLIQRERERLLDGQLAAAPPQRGGLAKWQIRRVDDYIARNLQGAVRVSDLATIAKLSTSYFSKAFTQSYGHGAREHIIRKRLERACEMMRGSTDPLSQIAAACGFADQAHLSTRFRRTFAMSPQAWRRLHQQDAA